MKQFFNDSTEVAMTEFENSRIGLDEEFVDNSEINELRTIKNGLAGIQTNEVGNGGIRL